MTSLRSPCISTPCLGYLRRLIYEFPPSTASTSFRQQVRGRKKLAKGPHTVNVRLLEDIYGYGRKGSIIPIAPGRMRNIYYPQRKAVYVTQAQLRALPQKETLVERDFTFGLEKSREDMPSRDESNDRAVFTKLMLMTPKRTRELIETLLPPELVFYRTPIMVSEQESPAPEAPVGNSINAIGGQIPVQKPALEPEPQPQATKIFGSVSTADMADAIKAILAEDENGARVVLGPDDIEIDEGVYDEPGIIEADRLKALGDYIVEIKLRGMDPLWRTVSIRAQETDLWKVQPS